MSLHGYRELPPVLRVPQVADLLDCGERAVRSAIDRGDLGSVRVGRLIRIPRHALVRFLETENLVKPDG